MKRDEFPKYVYTKAGSILVKDQDELDALESDYYESPADIPEDAPTFSASTGPASALDTSERAELEALRAERAARVNHGIPNQPEYPPAAQDQNPENERKMPDVLGPDHVERDRLEMEAKTIGLKVSKSWTDEELRRRILEKGSQ